MQLAAAALVLFCVRITAAQVTPVSFSTADDARIEADEYGSGSRAVVLAHGGQFNKESWRPQAERLRAAGFRVLALNFRGYGNSRGPGQADPLSAPLHLDVLAAVRYLHASGARSVSVVGGSMGGSAAADAASMCKPGEMRRLVLLGAAPYSHPERLTTATLFIATREDTSADGPRLPGIQAAYKQAPEPKRLMLLDGSAHAQFIFQTPDGKRVMDEILRFVSD